KENTKKNKEKDKEKGCQSNDYSCDTKGYIIFQPNLIIMGGRFSLKTPSHTPAHKHVKHDFQTKRAIKIIQSIYKYQVLIFVITKKVAAKTELAVLQKICSNDPHEESHCVHLLENGLYKGHPLLDIIITDLKPENIMLENDETISHTSSNRQLYYTSKDCSIRLIDFGSAVFERGLHHMHLIQTRHYRAPEVVYHMGWNFSADI
ncbi:hypothetical protein RFI_36524, partial [Reticulomyxa filosa]